MPSPFPHNRETAKKRLEEFLPIAPDYGVKRNFVIPGHPNVSRLSPAIRHRLLLESEVVESALKRFRLQAVEKFVQEVLWRTYWKGWMENHPSVWNRYVQRLKLVKNHRDPDRSPLAERICAGRSGVGLIDRLTCELVETGYLHNHARMWWASYWIHVARLPWEWGADFFFRHLIDADPASNTLSWRWVAGLHTRGKAYLIRESNLRRFCPAQWLDGTTGNGPLQDHLVQAAPIDEEARPAREPLRAFQHGQARIGGRVGLWIHPDDSCPEIGELSRQSLHGVCALVPRSVYAAMGLSGQRQKRLHTLLEDSVQRAVAHFNCRSLFAETTSLPAALAQWADREGLATVMAFAPFVGPVNGGLATIRMALEEKGIGLTLVRREWDSSFFPKASGGFFSFWKSARQEVVRHVADQ